MKKLATFFLTLLLAVSVHAQILSVPAAGVASTWSTTNKAAGIILSNGNLTETATGVGSDVMGRTDNGAAGSALIYYENHIDSVVTTHPGNGVMNASATFANFLGNDLNSIGYFTSGAVFFNGSQVATLGAYTTGALVGTAINRSAGLVWWTLDAGVHWNNATTATQNPVGVVGGISIPTGTVYPAYNSFSTDQSTANFGNTTFTNAALYATLQAAGYTTLP